VLLDATSSAAPVRSSSTFDRAALAASDASLAELLGLPASAHASSRATGSG
jgi:hypothetical protein